MIHGILFLSVILRLIKLDQSLWLDEAINIVSAKNLTFWDFVTKYPIGDFHPPAYFALLWIWIKLGGVGEVWVRIPSLVLGVATVWLVYLLGKELFNKKIATLASLFMALAPLHIYYSQEARMYSLATFAATLSFYFLFKRIWPGYILANVLVLYSDYLPYLIFPAQLVFIIWTKDKLFTKVGFLLATSFTFFIPWLFVFPRQLISGTGAATSLPGWASVVGGANLKQLLLIPIKTFFGRVSIDNKMIYAGLIFLVGIIYGLALWIGIRKLENAIKLLLLWLILPLGLAFLISFYIPVLAYFRMIFILPPLYLLLAKGVFSLPGKIIFPIISLICLISLISLAAYFINPKFQREDWKGAVNRVEEMADEQSVILLESNGVFSPYLYYSQKALNVQPGLKKIPAKTLNDINSIAAKEVFLFEYLVDITDPDRLLKKKLDNLGYRKIETFNFHGVGFVHQYSKL